MDAPKPNNTPATTTASDDAHPILFFDGVCGLCNRFVDFVLSRDPQGRFRFAPLQGGTARRRLESADVDALSTVILLDERGVHRQSSAVVRMLFGLGGVWTIPAAVLWLIPRPLRDVGYRCVARCRYRLFGKRETCRMPTPAERARFLP